MSRIFGLNYRLTFQTAYKIDSNLTNDVIIDGGLTIDFNINRSTFANMNEANIRIYNLSETTRTSMRKDRFQVNIFQKIILEAGYGQDLYTIFIGNVLEALSKQSGNDIIIEITAQDGGFDFYNDTVNITVNKGTSNKDLFDKLTATVTTLERGVIGNITGQIDFNKTFQGKTIPLLKDYFKDKIFVDLNKFNFQNEMDKIGDRVILISYNNDLLNTPRRADSTLYLDTIFKPFIQLHNIVEIKSNVDSSYNNQYRVLGLGHSGTISPTHVSNVTTNLSLSFFNNF